MKNGCNGRINQGMNDEECWYQWWKKEISWNEEEAKWGSIEEAYSHFWRGEQVLFALVDARAAS